MEDLILTSVLLFMYEIPLIITNCSIIFYSTTTKTIQIMNIVSILLFFIELFFINTKIIFIFHIVNIIIIFYIFYTLSQTNIENGENIEMSAYDNYQPMIF